RRVQAEQATEKAKAEGDAPAPHVPANVLPSDFTGSAHQPLTAGQVAALVEGWRATYADYPDDIVELLEGKLAAALKADKLPVPPERAEDRLRRRLRAYMQGSG